MSGLRLLAAACGLAAAAASAGSRAAELKPPTVQPETATHQVPRASSAIQLDGNLDESAWEDALSLHLAFDTNPGDNVLPPVGTECLVTYGERKLYVAFRAQDPEPSAIRAHLSDRDRGDQDDRVGIVLDTFDDGRRAFIFFVNPLGVQTDLSLNDVGGGEDSSWDAIWETAGRITAEGYVVEMAIPFSSLRFPRSEGAHTFGFDAVRIYPRGKAYRIGLHRVARSIACYLCQSSKLTGFTGITPGRNLELAPTLTTHRTDVRDVSSEVFPDTLFDKGSIDPDLGLSTRWGVTPSLTLNAAVNPDFSQVETDAAQLDVNTTFALFFPEKRPFFIEGADFFSTPLNAVYTRTVADPSFGLKLTGKEGKHAVGIFATRDERSNLLLPGSQGSTLTALGEPSDENPATAASVLRYRYDLGRSSTVGILFTDREGEAYHNRVLGLDGMYRFTSADTLRFQLLGSQTRYPETLAEDFGQPRGSFEDGALRVAYNHTAPNWYAQAAYEDLGKQFRADLGFLPQVDYRRSVAEGQYTFWAAPGAWHTRFGFGGRLGQTGQHDGTLLDREARAWLFGAGPMQSWAKLDLGVRTQHFDGVDFDQTFLEALYEMSPTGNVYFKLGGTFGDAIDFANTRAATQLILTPGLRLNFGRSLQAQLGYTLHRLEVDEGRLFLANLGELRLVYQFNVRTFLRAIVQYTDITRDPALYFDEVESRTRQLGNQLLFSYKLNPQTVVFLGYSDAYLDEAGIDLTQTDRTVFLKVGYALGF